MTTDGPGRPARRASTRLVVLTGAACLLTTTGGAYALWSVSGSGTARAATASPVALVVSAVTMAGDLYPGHTGVASFSVGNPNPFPVVVTAVRFGAVTAGSSGCTASQLTPHDRTGLSYPVPAGGSADLLVPGSFTLATSAPDSCQGVAFTAPATVTGTQG